jgi:hypothetical protein
MNQLTLNHNALASTDLEPLDHLTITVKLAGQTRDTLYQLHAFTKAANLNITGSNLAIQTDEPREADNLGVGAHPFTPTSLRKSYVLHTVAKWAKGA